MNAVARPDPGQRALDEAARKETERIALLTLQITSLVVDLFALMHPEKPPRGCTIQWTDEGEIERIDATPSLSPAELFEVFLLGAVLVKKLRAVAWSHVGPRVRPPPTNPTELHREMLLCRAEAKNHDVIGAEAQAAFNEWMRVEQARDAQRSPKPCPCTLCTEAEKR